VLDPPAAYAGFARQVELVKTYDHPEFDAELCRQKNGPDTWQRVVKVFPKSARSGTKCPCVVVPFYFPEAMIGFNLDDRSTTARPEPDADPLTYYRGLTIVSDLVRRGYACLSADAYFITYATEGAPAEQWRKWQHVGDALSRDWPTWTGMGKLVFDTKLLLDLAEADRRVDADRIGIAGHSLGGKMAVFTGMVDPRVKAVLANDPGVCWDRTNWNDSWYFGKKLEKMIRDGLDLADLVSCGGGKPFCLLCGESDGEWSRQLLMRASGYERHPENLVIIDPKLGVHNPRPWALECGYEFLDRHLGAGKLGTRK